MKIMRKNLAAVSAVAVCLSIGGLFPHATFGQVRVEPVQRPTAPEPATPATPFDRTAALQAIERGNSTIRGIACSYHDNYKFPMANKHVYLLPVTSYLNEWLQLRKKSRNKPVAGLLKEAFEVRVETSTDEKGHFQFPNMKPGRYYLMALMSFNQAKSRDVYAGSGYNSMGGTTAYFDRQDYTVGRSDLLERLVEVKRDGQTITVPLRNSGFWNKGGLLGKMLPCIWSG
jgi:hypothetical protein